MKELHRTQHQRQGFTIVELLIVVVVIAILATVTVVAFRGVQERAKNTATLAAAKQTLRQIAAYRTLTGEYPAVGGQILPGNVSYFSCITRETGCLRSSTGQFLDPNDELDANLATVGLPPQSVPGETGIYYNYYAPRTFNGEPSPALLVYHLIGLQSDCGSDRVTQGIYTAAVSTPRENYTSHLSALNLTSCVVSIP